MFLHRDYRETCLTPDSIAGVAFPYVPTEPSPDPDSTGYTFVCNDRGELLSFCLTPGNVDDRNPETI
ncbi:MAG: transposase [Tannerella sp.]|nr:transposase [Tannerella sp.]